MEVDTSSSNERNLHSDVYNGWFLANVCVAEFIAMTSCNEDEAPSSFFLFFLLYYQDFMLVNGCNQNQQRIRRKSEPRGYNYYCGSAAKSIGGVNFQKRQ